MGRKTTPQEPRNNQHVVRDNPPALPSDQVTFPLGKFPVTVAVHRSPRKRMEVEEAQVTVVVVLASTALVVELVEEELVVSAATGAASIVRDATKSTRSVAIEAIFFDI